MQDFQTYLSESKEGKNLHLTHLQDRVLEDGVKGARDAINFLQALRDMLSVGGGSRSVNLTSKFDGSPSIFAGVNPENGKFFVGTKGVFAQNAKLNYTNGDIEKNHPGEGLASKLKIALQYLPELGIRGVIQGDMMFSSSDLKSSKIDGVDMITFQPNTIVYAVPKETTLANQILNAKMGVVWHTSYTGKTMEDMQASFGVDIGKLKHTRNVWYRDATFTDASGTATFTDSERATFDNLLSQIGTAFRSISPSTLAQISGSETYKIQIMTWNNSKVREGIAIKDTAQHTRDLIAFVENKLNKNILDAKKSDTRANRIKEKNIVIGFYKRNAVELKKIFDLQNLIDKAKNMIVTKLETVKDIGTFLKTDTGFKVTAPEGFVAIHALNGNAVKLINQLNFSHANFTAQKEWQK